MTPVLSVVIPTRDRERRLARALASVQGQTITDIEILVDRCGIARVREAFRVSGELAGSVKPSVDVAEKAVTAGHRIQVQISYVGASPNKQFQVSFRW